MTEENKGKRKLTNRWERILLILIALFLIGVVLQKFGLKMVDTTEDSEIIENPHSDF